MSEPLLDRGIAFAVEARIVPRGTITDALLGLGHGSSRFALVPCLHREAAGEVGRHVHAGRQGPFEHATHAVQAGNRGTVVRLEARYGDAIAEQLRAGAGKRLARGELTSRGWGIGFEQHEHLVHG